MLARLQQRRYIHAQAAKLYAQILRQARQPYFYAKLRVPDTFGGRFDLLMLHAYLLFRRLRGESEAGRDLAQAVFDTMFDDLDRTLREMGVGDLSIGRKIKGMSEAFYGRLKAYEDSFALGPEALGQALSRNVFGTDAVAPEALRLAQYAADSAEILKGLDLNAFYEGNIGFAAIPQAGL